MKRVLLFILPMVLIFNGCKSDAEKKKEKEEEQAVKAVTKGISEMAEHADETEDKMEALKKMTPVSNDVLKSFLPETLIGLPRKSYNVTNTMGFSVGEATYEGDNDQRVKVLLYDCAGEAGAAFYSINYFLRLNMEQENDNGYTKAIKFRGGKAVETYSKSSEEYTLVYLAGERFLVTINGDHIELDKVKDAANSLDYGKLEAASK